VVAAHAVLCYPPPDRSKRIPAFVVGLGGFYTTYVKHTIYLGSGKLEVADQCYTSSQYELDVKVQHLGRRPVSLRP